MRLRSRPRLRACAVRRGRWGLMYLDRDGSPDPSYAGRRPQVLLAEVQSKILRPGRVTLGGGRRGTNEKSWEKHHEGTNGGGEASVHPSGGRPPAAESEIREV